jgi:DNA-binding XRE family transcriptional regulator
MKNEELKRARLNKLLTQHSLAEKVGYGLREKDICLFETGRKQPNPILAKRIAEALDADTNKIFPDL